MRVLALALFACLPALAACSGGSPTWTAASTSAVDVQACLNQTLHCGDTVVIPSGSSTWTTQVTMTPPTSCSANQGLTLQGATVCTGGCPAGSGGASLAFTDNTTITLSNASGSSLFVGQCSNTAFCTLENITFIDGVAQSNAQLGIQGTHGQVSFRAHNIHFQSALTTGVDAIFYNGYGLVDHWLTNSTSTAGNESTPLNFGGDLTTHGELNWNDATNFGSSEAIFVEDSQFVSANGGNTGEGLFDAYYGCKITLRHSIVTGFQVGGWHGTDSGGYRSCVLGDIYNLTLSTTPSQVVGNTRGGVLLFHDNALTGNWTTGWNLQYYRFLGQASSTGWGRAGAHRDWTPLSITQSAALSSVVTLGAPDWQANHSYTCSAGAPCQIGPLTNNGGTGIGGAGGFNYEATANCTSGGSAPMWNQTFPSGTQSDGTCTWTNIGGGTSEGPGGSGFCAANPDTPASSDATCSALSGGDTASRFFDANGGVYPFRDQPGRSHNQLLTPNYAWNNSGAGLPSPIMFTDSGTASIIQVNVDYFTNTAMPGYSPYTYPHPLQGALGGISRGGQLSVGGSVVGN